MCILRKHWENSGLLAGRESNTDRDNEDQEFKAIIELIDELTQEVVEIRNMILNKRKSVDSAESPQNVI